MASGGQADSFAAFGSEGRGCESSHHLSTSPIGSHLLTAAPFLKNDVQCYFINKGNKK